MLAGSTTLRPSDPLTGTCSFSYDNAPGFDDTNHVVKVAMETVGMASIAGANSEVTI